MLLSVFQCRWTAPHKIAQTISSWVCSKSKKACSVIMYESIKVAYVVTGKFYFCFVSFIGGKAIDYFVFVLFNTIFENCRREGRTHLLMSQL